MSKKAWVAYGSRKDVGASPLFSPLHHGIETAAPDLQGRLYRSPLLYGPKQSRLPLTSSARTSRLASAYAHWQPRELAWDLQTARPTRSDLQAWTSPSALPDLLYNKKMAYIRSLHVLNTTDPERYVLYMRTN
jgi:hypothetical protein